MMGMQTNVYRSIRDVRSFDSGHIMQNDMIVSHVFRHPMR
jgi:hypothetical protein